MRGRRWSTAIGTVAVLLGAAGTGAAQEAPVLPPPTLSSTDLHVGDVVTVTGTGCLDPETGSGEGLTAMAFRWLQGRTEMMTNEVRFPVRADGSYSGDWTIGQALPDGPVSVAVTCFGGSLQGYDLLSDSLPATGNAPQLPDIVGRPGATVPVDYPCPDDGYLLTIYLDDIEGPRSAVAEGFGDVGGSVDAVVPAVSAGTYAASAGCHSEGGTYAFFTVDVVVLDASNDAPPATPQPGSAGYTG